MAVSILLAVALVAVIGVIFLHRATGDAPTGGAAAAASGDCLPADTRITADPAVADALEAIIADTGCSDVAIHSEDSAVTAAALAAGGDPDFDLWVPDSAMWPAQVTRLAKTSGVDAAGLVVGDTIASTPVVFAATETTATALSAAGADLSGLADGSLSVVLPDPTTAAASDAALLALQKAVDGDARTFTGLVLALETGVVDTPAKALEVASTAKKPTIAVATEQALQEYNASAKTALVPIPLFDATPVVSIPIVTAAGSSADVLAAATSLASTVAGGSDRLFAHDLRDAAGAADGAEAVSVGTDATMSANRAEVLRTWQVLTAPSRMLALNDVSGSMNEPATKDLSRIALFEKAAVRAINSLSTDSSLAIWVFSSRRIGGQDWQEVVPFGSLGDPKQKQTMIDTANKLDDYVGGGTGLYDSVLAAVEYMQDSYVEGEVNLVLLNTDGVNEDDDGLDLDGLLTKLRALHDPAKPVSVIAIGYGPDTDQDALEKIAAATDGAAYQALAPTDITSVLVDAVTQRGCRPNCG
ncbi:VWA domain-containing protein [Microbacterium sp. KR10-403]|uniref:VWA domain-containing protein n=1 Tax=Microbacterium sp. KR10-403 TaxID=3158581 RepID=UPI0032E44906